MRGFQLHASNGSAIAVNQALSDQSVRASEMIGVMVDRINQRFLKCARG